MPQFNREPLAAETSGRGIAYRYEGEELGGRPRDPALLTDGAPDYDKIAADPRLLETLGTMVAAATTRRVVLLCSEGDPAECHWGRLLGRVLVNRFAVDVAHITADGLRSQLNLLPEQTTLFGRAEGTPLWSPRCTLDARVRPGVVQDFLEYATLLLGKG